MSKIPGKVSRRYAKALFELQPRGELDNVRSALEGLSKLWNESTVFRSAMLTPSTPIAERRLVASDVAAKFRPGDQSFASFLMVLLENGRLAALPGIAAAFGAMVDELKKLLSLEITSAFPVSEEERGEIQKKLSVDLGTAPAISWAVDPEILGGLLVKAGDLELDGSIRGSLERVRRELAR